jgi:DNA topoisomerase-1
MIKNLLIVESPAKAKTIEKYLEGEFVVKASNGHIRDLPNGDKAIDIENGFLPTYEINPDKKNIVNELKKLAQSATDVWLATDDDREGEAISWHLKEVLDLKKHKRIVFREITKNAIQKAIQNPREIDENLVFAQQARRVLDRLVGYKLSPVLWQKIKTGLSAGRVQSVALRLVVEREREIDKFVVEKHFKIVGQLINSQGKKVFIELNKKFETEKQAQEFLEKCISATFTVENIEKKPARKSPSAPFTTSTLQQEASLKLSMPVGLTMSVAQKLYEAGLITYMRTDSVNLSGEAISTIENQVTQDYGKDYFQARKFENKSQNAQEAHEAIRPTDFSKRKVSAEFQRLYDLIWKRAIASQMADAKLERTTATIGISNCSEEKFIAVGEVMIFEGFLKVYGFESDSEEDDESTESKQLPALKIGESLKYSLIKAIERFSRPPARYSEAALVKKLEELGIGRPSTYATTISNIQNREYVIKESREGTPRPYILLSLEKGQITKTNPTETVGNEKNKLFPTSIGMIVCDFLVKYFGKIMDYKFTAKIEEEFDAIAEGNLKWSDMLADFYGSFKEKVEGTLKNVERSEIPTSRLLGEDPTTQKPVFAKLGKFGNYAQLGKNEDETGVKPKFAKLRNNQYIDTITLEEALELFKLPKSCGTFEDKEIVANLGRFGPYLLHDKKFYSLPKGVEPMDVDQEQAIEIILNKRESDANKIMRTFEEDHNLQILKGRWGPYISFKNKSISLPKGTDVTQMSYSDCLKFVEADKQEDKPKKKPAYKKKK